MQTLEAAAGECWQLLRQLVRETLQGDDLEQAYGVAILARIDRWSRGRSAQLSVADLPLLTCQAAGGTPERAVPLLAAWQALHIAAKLFDDIEDGDAADPAADVNVATAVLASVPLLLGTLDSHAVPADRIRRLTRAAQRAVIVASAGQHADLLAARAAAVDTDPERWLAIARAKSGALLRWAAWAGAYLAEAEEAALDHYAAYGEHLGVLLQVADDFAGIWQPEAASDLAAGRLSLPVCYALSVVPSDQRAELRDWLDRSVGQESSQAALRQRLTELGAQAYMIVTARIYQRHALAALQRIELTDAAARQLAALAEQIFPGTDYLKLT